MNISKKKKKKRFPWGRSGGKTIFRSPAPLIKAVRAFEIQEIGRFRASQPLFSRIYGLALLGLLDLDLEDGQPLKALYIAAALGTLTYWHVPERPLARGCSLASSLWPRGQPRKTASGSLNRVKKGDLVKKSGFWSEILDFSVFLS